MTLEKSKTIIEAEENIKNALSKDAQRKIKTITEFQRHKTSINIKTEAGNFVLDLTRLARKGILNDAQILLKNKEEGFEKKDFIDYHQSASCHFSFILQTGAEDELHHFLLMNGEKITKEDIISNSSKLAGFISDGILGKANDFIVRNGEKIDRKDLEHEEGSGRSAMSQMIQSGRLDELDDILQKSDDSLKKEDIFKRTKHASPYELSVNSTAFAEVHTFMDKKGWKLEEKDLFDGKKRTPVFEALIRSANRTKLVEVLNEIGKTLNRSDVLPDGELKDSPLEHAVKLKQFDLIAKNMETSSEPITREDLIKPYGSIYKNLLAQIVANDQLETVQELCKKNGEASFSIRDIPPDSSSLLNIAKFVGIKGFSDKPKDLKDFWDKMSSTYKNEERTKIYQKSLRNAATFVIANTKGGGR